MPLAGLRSLRAQLHGHRHTIAPFVANATRPVSFPDSRRIRVPFVDPVRGAIALTARMGPEPTSRGVVVAIHGMGGHAGSAYLAYAAQAAERAGLGCVRMNMRGSDRGGDDIYHGGLGGDVATLLASDELRGVSSIFLLGYSLGGHLALRYAVDHADPRVKGVAAVCAPLDFDRGVDFLDVPSGVLYRQHLLRGLREVYEAASKRSPFGPPLEATRAIKTLREWDHHVVAPRFGFRSAKHYYDSVSVGPDLDRLRYPTLLVVAEHDPMVRSSVLEPSLRKANARVVRTDSGGHVGFPRGIDLGLGFDGGVEDQILAHLLAG